MNTNFDDQLALLRPAPHWSTDERETVLNQVLAAESSPCRADGRLTSSRPHRRRRLTLVAVGAVAAAAAIVVPTVLPSGTPGAARSADATQALRTLAHIAAVSPVDHLAADQYRHYIVVGHQASFGSQPASDSRFEFWTSPTGRTWQKRQVHNRGSSPDENEVWVYRLRDNNPSSPSPRYLATLATDPAALDDYLRAHTSGSTSSDERVFVAIGDMLQVATVPPALRSAAIEVLARLGHVALGTETRDARGNPVQEFDFIDRDNRPDEIQALMFDTGTAQITETRDYFHGTLLYRSNVTLDEVVDSVPAQIRDRAVLVHN